MTTRSIVNLGNLPPHVVKNKYGGKPSNLPRKVLSDITGRVALLGVGSVAEVVKEKVGGKKATEVAEHEKDYIKNATEEAEHVLFPAVEEEIYCTPQEEVVVGINGRVLPPGVRDIDSEDLQDPQLCSEYAQEIFSYMRSLEDRDLVREGHLVGLPTNEKMRGVLVDWLVDVQGQFRLLQETLHSTVDIIDRYMAVEGASVDRARLQLVGVSAMFLAAKVEEMFSPPASDFVYICNNAYTEKEIRAMELKIVRALQFRFTQPVAINFLRRFSKVGDVDILQHTLAKYCLEECLTSCSMVPVPGSKVAASSLYLSLLLLEPPKDPVSSVWNPTLTFYSGYTMEELLPTVKKIASILVKSPRSKLQAVRKKYTSAKLWRVSELPQLRGEVIVELANSAV